MRHPGRLEPHSLCRDQEESMDRLYVVDLEVQGIENLPGSTFDRAVRHVRDWLLRPCVEPKPALDLTKNGEEQLLSLHHDTEYIRAVDWTAEAAGDLRVLGVGIRQAMEGTAAGTFASDITVLEEPGLVSVRIELGREVEEGLLTPATVKTLRRPALLGLLLRDAELKCRVRGQLVTGQPVFIAGAETAELVKSLKNPKRLPLLLVDGRSASARGFAHIAAPELVGMAQVVVLSDDTAASELSGLLADVDAPLPPRGARLIWPALEARHPEYTASQVRRWHPTTGSLLWMAGGVSVAARGDNPLLAKVARAKRREREASFEAALREAQNTGDTAKQVETLEGRVAQLTADYEEALDLYAEADKRATSLEDAHQQALFYKNLWLEEQKKGASEPSDPWAELPALLSHDLAPLADELEELSGGAIAFTDEAKRSWKQSKYPHTERMQEHLVTLTRAAIAWRDADCRVEGMVDDWFRTTWHVAMAATDKGLPKKLAKFTYENQQYGRAPHLKLDDNTNPGEVGRVYFAMDAENKRFIVDYVGLKLYGL